MLKHVPIYMYTQLLDKFGPTSRLLFAIVLNYPIGSKKNNKIQYAM